jgi:hypothetical protein
MRRAARVASVIGLSSLLSILVAAPAAAFDLNGGCTLTISSTDASGAALDSASGDPGGGQGGTQGDPFIVDWDGTVSWNGSSGSQVFMDHSWQVSVFGIPTPLRGGDPNDGGDTTAEGSTGVSENAPIELTGVFNVSGDINGAEGAHCDGSGWFKLNGNPLTTIPFWLAVVIAVVGLLLLLSARPTASGAVPAAGPPPYEPPPAPPASEPMP